MSMTKQEYYTKLEEDEKYSDIYWENESSPIDEYMEKTHNPEEIWIREQGWQKLPSEFNK